MCAWTQLRETHSLWAKQGWGAENRCPTRSDKNTPVWQGPLGHPPSRYPGRNPACQSWSLPLPQHRAVLNEATTSPSPGMGLASLMGQCWVGTAPSTLFSASQRGQRRKEAQGEKLYSGPQAPGVLHLKQQGRTHQLEDVLILGHDGELQSIIATETGQGVRPG